MSQASEMVERLPETNSLLRCCVRGYPEESVADVAAFISDCGFCVVNYPRSPGVSQSVPQVSPNGGASVDGLSKDLSDDSDLLLVFIASPQLYIAEALAVGRSFQDAENKWINGVAPFLELLEFCPEKMLLFTLDELYWKPEAFVEMLSERLHVRLAFPEKTVPYEKKRVNDFLLVLANQYVEQHDQLSGMVSAIEARKVQKSINFGIFQNIDCQGLLEEINSLRNENQVLFEHVHKLQLDLEDCVLKLKNQQTPMSSRPEGGGHGKSKSISLKSLKSLRPFRLMMRVKVLKRAVSLVKRFLVR